MDSSCSIESICGDHFQQWAADLWWMSPPCQPYTRRGCRRDTADPRAQSLLALLEHIKRFRPAYVALENVVGFADSKAHDATKSVLESCGYYCGHCVLCPTQFGLPNRRPRFYLIANRDQPVAWRAIDFQHRSLASLLDSQVDDSLFVPAQFVADYLPALNLVRACERQSVTNCFTSAYGRSHADSGSLLVTQQGVRRFSPAEILRLLGFPAAYRLPSALPLERAWSLVGNSLSVPVVRHVLSSILPA